MTLYTYHDHSFLIQTGLTKWQRLSEVLHCNGWWRPHPHWIRRDPPLPGSGIGRARRGGAGEPVAAWRGGGKAGEGCSDLSGITVARDGILGMNHLADSWWEPYSITPIVA